MTNEELFFKLVKNHNVLYFECNGQDYLEGRTQYEELVKVGQKIDRATAVKIWNDNVDLISDLDERKNWYWTNFETGEW
jgi:hypothetical protein